MSDQQSILKKMAFTAAALVCLAMVAQAQNFRKIDKSPLDKAFYPDNFAHDRKAGEEAIVRVTYSRPSKNDREVFGKLVPYGEVWRCGANESTEIKFYKDVELNGKKVSAGSYSLFAIPGEKEWTIILNSDLDYWGAFKYNPAHDVVRVMGTAAQESNVVENFTIQFDKGKDGAKGVMQLAWDKTVVDVPFNY